MGIERARCGSLVAALVIAAFGCGDDPEDGCPGDACPPAGTEGTAGPVTSEDGTTSAPPATDDGQDTTAAETSSPGDAADDTGGDGGGRVVCDPANAMFTDGEPPAEQIASIQIDAVAMTCAAQGTPGEAPRIQLEIRQTGMVDAVTYGIEVEDSTLGVVFPEPSVGDSQVTQLPPDLPLTITGTLIDGGTPIEIDFEIFSTGPTVIDVAVTFL